MSRHYRFDGAWTVDLPRRTAYEHLIDLEHYPDWWPEIRAVAKLGPDDARVLIRSRLPYTLDLVLHAVHRREDLLETTISGDLVGWVQWGLEPSDEKTRLTFAQEVEVSGRLLGWASYVARPLLVWNHDRMMRSAVGRIPSRPRD
ncbi:MAG: polyketide cyclase [Nocardioides sp.]|nr:polyketide cyclase [Nocardioides sp.]